MPDMIHSSHSKKDLLELINTFQIDVIGAGEQSRQRLGINLWNKVLADMNHSDTHCDAREIHHFLHRRTPSRGFPTRLRIIGFDKVRNILHYAKDCNYVVHLSNYDRFEDILEDAKYLANFGDEPSVRRAIKLFNKDAKLEDIIEPKISPKVLKSIQERERIKKDTRPRMKIKTGDFTLSFD